MMPHLHCRFQFSLHSRPSICLHLSLIHALHIWLQPNLNTEFFPMPLCLYLNCPLTQTYMSSKQTNNNNKSLLSFQGQLKHLPLCKDFLGKAHTDLARNFFVSSQYYEHTSLVTSISPIGDSKVWLT